MRTETNAFISLFTLICLIAVPAAAQTSDKPFEPVSGQAGKDVVWVPTPPVVVEKMLDVAKVSPADYVIDLGSGDGRNVIAAAKRGARALGVEYNPDMVDLSTRAAAAAGVGDKASFVQGDMYEADISQASVLALFLLPENLDKLIPKFLDLKPGTRIVLNTFGIRGWNPDENTHAGEGCGSWCDVLLYIVPARAAGQWRLPQGELTLEQEYQILSGTLTTGGANVPITNGRVRGDQLSFSAGGIQYTGRINGSTIEGSAGGDGSFRATRIDH